MSIFSSLAGFFVSSNKGFTFKQLLDLYKDLGILYSIVENFPDEAKSGRVPRSTGPFWEGCDFKQLARVGRFLSSVYGNFISFFRTMETRIPSGYSKTNPYECQFVKTYGNTPLVVILDKGAPPFTKNASILRVVFGRNINELRAVATDFIARQVDIEAILRFMIEKKGSTNSADRVIAARAETAKNAYNRAVPNVQSLLRSLPQMETILGVSRK